MFSAVRQVVNHVGERVAGHFVGQHDAGILEESQPAQVLNDPRDDLAVVHLADQVALAVGHLDEDRRGSIVDFGRGRGS